MKVPRCLNGKEGCAIKEPHRHTPGNPDDVTYSETICQRCAVLDRALDLTCAQLFRSGVGKVYAPGQKVNYIGLAEQELAIETVLRKRQKK